MKVKSLLLSMCAIAALASCSQNDDVAPSASEAAEAKVTIQLEGDGVNTRAGSTAPETGAAVSNVTVFFFNETDFIVGKPQYVAQGDLAKLGTDGLKTTTDATKIVVIANLGNDLTGTTFKNVSSLSQLKKVDFTSIADGAGGTKTVNQNVTNLYSSGMAGITMTDNTGHADVQLHFVAAKIDKVKIDWLAVSTPHYATDENDLKATGDKWFFIKQVYLMTAQTNSPLIPAGATTGSWTGGFAPQSYDFAGGVAWGGGKWNWTDGGITAPVQTADYLVTPIPAVTGDGIANVLGVDATNKPWYVFENPEASGHKTGLVIEVLWKSKDNPTDQDYLTKYFTVYFGEKAVNTSAQPLIEAGKSYAMTIGLKGDFKPGGNAGGGGDDPTKPTVDAQITVTVKAAEWDTTGEISKDFQ